MSGSPRLTVGLPVYNGADHVAEAIEALLGQSYEDFELIISDNASTDDTGDICRSYECQDSRVRYFRQPTNLGSTGNHCFVFDEARGELFKFASHDDLYARELLEQCVAALDAYPDVVLVHSFTAMINESGELTKALSYPLLTASRNTPERFRSLLFGSGGDDFYGVMRTNEVRPAMRPEIHHHSDRIWITHVGLFGPFYQVPDWLYFRREHPEMPMLDDPIQDESGSWPDRDWPLGRKRCVNMDPRRRNRLLYPAARLYAEYVWGYVTGIRYAPLSSADRLECYRYLGEWLASRAHLMTSREAEQSVRPPSGPISVDALVPGRQRVAR